MPSRAQAKRWRALKRRKGRGEYGLFLAEGPHLVEELLGSSLTVRHVLYTAAAAEEPDVAALLDRCAGREVATEEVPDAELEEFADTVTPQGILAVAEIPQWGDAALGSGDAIVLDAVQDPGNVGTIVRTAEALGAGGVVALKGTVDLWNPKVVRASAGSLFRLPAVSAEWPELWGRLRDAGVEVWAADVEGEALARESARPGRVALVLGNEGAGVRAELLTAADRRVAVPVPGRVESLNVAVAAAILMDRLLSARQQGPGRPEPDGGGSAAVGGEGEVGARGAGA